MGSSGAGIGMGAASGALGGAISGAAGGPFGMIVGAIIGAALGAATSAIGTALAREGMPLTRKQNDIITTSTTRATPVAVAFGRNRTGGNIMAVGYFLYENTHIKNATGLIWRANYIIGLCEGGPGVLAFGNVRQDGQEYYDLAVEQNVYNNVNQFYRFTIYPGSNDQVVPNLVLDPKHGYFMLPHVAWRNTTVLQVYTIAGDLPRLPDINIDMMGPDYTIRRNGNTGEPNPLDQALEAFYDGYTESFYYTIYTSRWTPLPYGLVGVGRQSTPERSHTPPPTAVKGVSVQRAWYVGRHDVLVMQDPSDSALFHIGWWGITPDDPGWESHRPDPGYAVAINRWHLDEVHGILHTFHSPALDGATPGYVMRWTLLTGRVQRMPTNVTDYQLAGFIYCAEMDCYVLLGETGMHFLDPDTGLIFKTTNTIIKTNVLNLCVSGQLIGAIGTKGIHYFDPFADATFGPYGNDGDATATNSAPGNFGGVTSMHQNTWTGHVTLACIAGDGNPSLVNFIPSIVEDIRDLNANGTSGLGQDPLDDNTTNGNTITPTKDFQIFPKDNVAGWIRDWSVRQTEAWYLVSLQGNSSLAAAMWAANVDEPNLDSKRWGAALPASYYNLSSFEGLHAYCVGGVKMRSPDGTVRRAERYKFDFMLTGEVNVGEFNSDQVLTCCQGWRTTIDGQMHVGVPKPGQWPLWHFNDRNIELDPGITVDFIGRSQGVNRVRIQYRDVLTEYRHDFAEADNDWDQQQRNRIQQATISAEGCGRYGQAYLLCMAVLDQTQGGRRQTTHLSNYAAWLMSSTDPVEVSSLQAGLLRMPAKIVSIKEEGKDEKTQFVCLEHRSVMDALGGVVNTYGSGSGIGQNGGLSGGTDCALASSPLDGSDVWFNGGANYPAGDYEVTYVGGSYRTNTHYNNMVAGFQIISEASDGSTIIIGNAPGVSVVAPGWPTPADAADANLDQTFSFALANSGPIGIWYPENATVLSAIGESPDQTPNPPTYQLCPIASLAVPAGTPDPSALPSTLHVHGYASPDMACTQCATYNGTVWDGIIANDVGTLQFSFHSLNHNNITVFGHLTSVSTPPPYVVPGIQPVSLPDPASTGPFRMWLLQCICAWQSRLPVSGLPGWILRLYCGVHNGTETGPENGVGAGTLVWEGELPGENPVGTYAITPASCTAGPATISVS